MAKQHFRVICPECGDVRLPLSSVVGIVHVADDRTAYAYVCPWCGVRRVHECPPRVVDLVAQYADVILVYPADEPRPEGDQPLDEQAILHGIENL